MSDDDRNALVGPIIGYVATAVALLLLLIV